MTHLRPSRKSRRLLRFSRQETVGIHLSDSSLRHERANIHAARFRQELDPLPKNGTRAFPRRLFSDVLFGITDGLGDDAGWDPARTACAAACGSRVNQNAIQPMKTKTKKTQIQFDAEALVLCIEAFAAVRAPARERTMKLPPPVRPMRAGNPRHP